MLVIGTLDILLLFKIHKYIFKPVFGDDQISFEFVFFVEKKILFTFIEITRDREPYPAVYLPFYIFQQGITTILIL